MKMFRVTIAEEDRPEVRRGLFPARGGGEREFFQQIIPEENFNLKEILTAILKGWKEVSENGRKGA